MKRKSSIITVTVFIIVFIFINFYTLPYYITRPGMAKELDEVIQVTNGYDEQGTFMLTTVRMGEANIVSFIAAKFNKYYELLPINVVRSENETDEEYTVRQLYYMEDSQENALQIAFEKAGKTVNVTYNGVYVLQVAPNMPAEGILKPGDRILKVDNTKFDSTKAFTDYIQGKTVGETVRITFLRNNKEITETIQLATIPSINKPGIGIALVDDKEVVTDPTVKINTAEIGGPSAGFMFSLEIYNRLVEEDITKGYKIAGTGTISPDGTVGEIGGIEQKIVAADKSGAEIFFAPNQNGARNSNYENAVKTAKDIGTDMKIVPIDIFDDAISYLKALPEKKK